ncbi:uncharacterized protein LOC111877337 [Lactuca sativa]|uniref:uncharacterized protein LOC111877337 n=1 Tax=Lactuca sativa TaxID=4236 RepID=UPI000CD87A76|nr:uncharacterized protein LOC111877337 [Lactuca sativa]
MIKFMTKNILVHVGTPTILISDKNTQFEGSPFKEWCEDKKIHRRFTSVAHPQANGHTKISQKTIVKGLKKWLLKSKSVWVDELLTVLWSYRTTTRSSTGETPFSLTYGTEVVLPLEIVVGYLRTESFEELANDEGQRQDLDMLDEKREATQMRQALYKSQTENYYNCQVRAKNFKVGE